MSWRQCGVLVVGLVSCALKLHIYGGDFLRVLDFWWEVMSTTVAFHTYPGLFDRIVDRVSCRSCHD